MMSIATEPVRPTMPGARLGGGRDLGGRGSVLWGWAGLGWAHARPAALAPRAPRGAAPLPCALWAVCGSVRRLNSKSGAAAAPCPHATPRFGRGGPWMAADEQLCEPQPPPRARTPHPRALTHGAAAAPRAPHPSPRRPSYLTRRAPPHTPPPPPAAPSTPPPRVARLGGRRPPSARGRLGGAAAGARLPLLALARSCPLRPRAT